MANEWDFWVDTRHDEEGGVTVAYIHNWVKSPTGVAKCMPEDAFDPELGELFAVGRLLKQIGESLIAEAYGEVHYRDELEQRRTESAAKALELKRQKTYEFQCEFAALINAVLEQDTVLSTRFQTTGSVLKDAVINGKGYGQFNRTEVRSNLPA